MEVKVLGTGCSKCMKTCSLVEKVIRENNVDATLEKVEDIMELMKFNIMAAPAVVVDGVVRIKGHVPSENEVKEILGL